MTDICSQNIFQLLLSPIVLGGLPIFVYDVLVEKKPYMKSLYDASLMTGSSFASKILSNLLNEKIVD
jgi:hypothetical protein